MSAAFIVAGSGVDGILRFISRIVAKEEDDLRFCRHNIDGGVCAALIFKDAVIIVNVIIAVYLCISDIVSVGEGDADAAFNHFNAYDFRSGKILGYRNFPNAVGVRFGGVARVGEIRADLDNSGLAIGKGRRVPCREGHVVIAHLLIGIAVGHMALLHVRAA